MPEAYSLQEIVKVISAQALSVGSSDWLGLRGEDCRSILGMVNDQVVNRLDHLRDFK
jgi:hypothetical protein